MSDYYRISVAYNFEIEMVQPTKSQNSYMTYVTVIYIILCPQYVWPFGNENRLTYFSLLNKVVNRWYFSL